MDVRDGARRLGNPPRAHSVRGTGEAHGALERGAWCGVVARREAGSQEIHGEDGDRMERVSS
jgi:hypothetical protein